MGKDRPSPVNITFREEHHTPPAMPISGVMSFATGICQVHIHECPGCKSEEMIVALLADNKEGGLFIPLSRYRAIQLAEAMLELASSMPGPQHDQP